MNKRLVWLLITVALIGAGVAAALFFSGSSRRANVLVISIDTLRADRLGSYGYANAQTPVLDALAARGVRFAEAATSVPLTLPAHTSLLTGEFPARHGVRDNGGFYVDAERLTLAEVLRDRGYRTGAFVGAFVLDSRWGLDQGFDQYFDDFDLSRDLGPGMDAIQRPGSEVVSRAIEWLREPSEAPFFAWVHLYDPHTPYEAPEPFRSRYPRTLDGAYDAEVASTDSEVGRLLNELSSMDRASDTLIVVVADHGESLGQHGEQTHGFFIYDSVLRIPLIIAGPGIASRVVNGQVRIVDVMPTILGLLDIPVPSSVQGQTLVPAMSGQVVELLAFAENWYPRYHYGWSELTAVRDGRYKFIQAPRRELYDVQKDPGELHDLASTHPARAEALERALREMQTSVQADAHSTAAPQRVDPEVEERLRALGYVSGTVNRHVLEDRPRGDPKDKIRLYNLLKQAGQDSVEGRIDDAIAKVREALMNDADIVEGHVMLGNLYVKDKQEREAIQAYRRALSLDPEHQGATFSLALAYRSAGDESAALAGFERANTLDPRSGKALFQIADLHMQGGRFGDAERILEEGLRLDVDRPAFLVKLGECRIERQAWDEAEQALREAIDAKPDLAQAHYDLALIYEHRELFAEAMAEYELELSHHPKTFAASFNLAKLLSRAGRPTEALKRFRETVDTNPAFAEGHLYFAKALLDAGDLPNAEEAARRGLAAGPAPSIAPLGHYVLADVFNRVGKAREAEREVARARSLERGSR